MTKNSSIWYPLLISCGIIIALFLSFDGIEEYFRDSVNSLIANKQSFKITSFLILSSDIVLPVPSSIIMYLNGAVIGMWQGAILSFFSVMVSSVIGYYIGKLSLKVFKGDSTHKTSNQLIEKYGSFAIILTRGIPILSESVIIVAGYNKYDLKKFIFWNCIGYAPVCLLYAYFGSISSSQEAFLISFGISLGIAFLFWLIGRKIINKKHAKSE